MNSAEWLETDGLGGFAMGNNELIPERRYHALLASSQQNSLARQVLVLGVETYLQSANQSFGLSGLRYKGGVIHPKISLSDYDVKFSHNPCPRWIYNIPSIGKIEFSILMLRGENCTILKWQTDSSRMDLSLKVRPFLVCRDIHHLRKESGVVIGHENIETKGVFWAPFESSPGVMGLSSGQYQSAPFWYRDIYLCEESARGYDYLEDAYSPGEFIMPLTSTGATLAFSNENKTPPADINAIREQELTRRSKLSQIERGAEHYLIKRGEHSSVIAGYPWFNEWGRDTFVSLRGLAFPFGRLAHAERVLASWGSEIRNGIVPNYFDEKTSAPFFNSVDSSLWFIITAFELIKAAQVSSHTISTLKSINKAIELIIKAFINGTDYGIGMDSDFLLKAGKSGVQLTWMDAKIGDNVVTQRLGKPVEVQALWINALRSAAFLLEDSSLATVADKAQQRFGSKFWSEKLGYYFDVIDCEGRLGETDASLRPNQIFALGGLPWRIVEDQNKIKKVLKAVEESLLTPYGLRTIAPEDPRYSGIYEGSQAKRDLSYHQGSAWPWLLGAFVDAWLFSKGFTTEAKLEAKARFLNPLWDVFKNTGLAPELTDGDAPNRLRGCPFQAWTLGEIIRISEACDRK